MRVILAQTAELCDHEQPFVFNSVYATNIEHLMPNIQTESLIGRNEIKPKSNGKIGYVLLELVLIKIICSSYPQKHKMCFSFSIHFVLYVRVPKHVCSRTWIKIYLYISRLKVQSFRPFLRTSAKVWTQY